ncbi:hypothetical protein LSAT2_005647 [Lamellibrachia satsuma]|nr:hypothetical protein LSAT2_005647 [Lamellibrachia satsuma]
MDSPLDPIHDYSSLDPNHDDSLLDPTHDASPLNSNHDVSSLDSNHDDSPLVNLLETVSEWREAGGQAGRRAGGQAGRRAGGQAGRRAGGQAGRRAETSTKQPDLMCFAACIQSNWANEKEADMLRYNVMASSLLLATLVCCGINVSAEWVKHGDLCYYFSSIPESRPWSRAYQLCAAKDAILARVESEDVNNFIHSIIPSVHQAHWVGIVDIVNAFGVHEMVYADDRQKIVYSHYADGEPLHSRTFLRGGVSTMEWFTGNNNHMYQYICQKPCE